MGTVQTRLTLGVIALISLLVLALSVVEAVQLRSFLVDSEATRVRAQAKALVDAAAATEFDPGVAAGLATALTSADTGALVLAPDGSVLGAPAPGTVGAPAPSAVPAGALARAAAGEREVDVVRDGDGGRELLVLVPEPGGDPARAVIAMTTSLAEEDALARRQSLAILAGLGLALLPAVAGSLLLVRRSLRPLGRIATAAEEVAAGDFARRVQLGAPPDEIGRLAEAFDTMTAALQRTFADLERSERRSRAFVADASHELRTPLTTVAGFTDVLLRRAPADDDEFTRLLAALRREVDRMQRIVEDLLLLAQADGGGLVTARERVDLQDAARRVVEQLSPLRGHRRFVVDGAAAVAASDPDRVHQILLNLVGNALRHTPAYGVIALSTASAGGRAVITISDDGEGMDEPTRRLAFERFARGGRARRGTGAGLGLSIVAALVAALDGDVALDSRPGEGTSVRISLPTVGVP